MGWRDNGSLTMNRAGHEERYSARYLLCQQSYVIYSYKLCSLVNKATLHFSVLIK